MLGGVVEGVVDPPLPEPEPPELVVVVPGVTLPRIKVNVTSLELPTVEPGDDVGGLVDAAVRLPREVDPPWFRHPETNIVINIYSILFI